MFAALAGRQRNALGCAIVLCIVIPFVAFPLKAEIYAASPATLWLFKVALASLLPLAAIWLLATRFGIAPAAYGISLPLRFRTDLVSVSILIALSLYFVYLPVGHLAWRLLWPFIDAPVFLYRQALPDGMWYLPAIVAISLDAGFFESIVFIGMPWLLLRERCESGSAKMTFALVTSIIFGCCHRGNGLHEVIAVTIFSLIAMWWFFRLGELWPVIFGHALADVIGYL